MLVHTSARSRAHARVRAHAHTQVDYYKAALLTRRTDAVAPEQRLVLLSTAKVEPSAPLIPIIRARYSDYPYPLFRLSVPAIPSSRTRYSD